MPATFPVYLEVGSKRVFASALNWPGWARSGKTEEEALERLFEYGPRYAKVVPRLGFVPPKSASAFKVEERVKGNATTDFGAPGVPSSKDGRSLKTDELTRLVAILEKCWTYLDDIAAANKGKTLAKGPRGGGRTLTKIVTHVNEADGAYLGGLGGKYKGKDVDGLRAAIVDMLKARARGEDPPLSPRRKTPLWSPRYAIRRSAWHALDHAWEIEDRAE